MKEERREKKEEKRKKKEERIDPSPGTQNTPRPMFLLGFAS